MDMEFMSKAAAAGFFCRAGVAVMNQLGGQVRTRKLTVAIDRLTSEQAIN